jgi:hypothetical protein
MSPFILLAKARNTLKLNIMKITAKQINEIAQQLEAGMKVFINRETLEYKSVLDWDEMVDPEPWEEMTETIENEWPDAIILEKMDTREAFRVMEDFIDEIQEDLIKILSRRSPFANFKAEVDTSEYRELWFSFRTKKYEYYIRDRLSAEGIICE